MAHIELSQQARRDFEGMPTNDRQQIRSALEALGRGDPVDVRPLLGLSPWSCLRIGDNGLLHRPLTAEELAGLGHPEGDGWLVGCVVAGVPPQVR
jgi:hypothetical protein